MLLVTAVVLVDTVFFAVLSPLLPGYAAALGLSKSAAGVLAGAFAAGVLVAALPSGLLASRLGLRRTLLLGLGLTGVTSVLFGLADGFSVLVLTRFLAGLGSACSWTAALGWLARAAPSERRGELIGLAISAAVAGAVLGPALGAAAAWVGTGPAFATVALACAALSARVVALTEPEAEPGKVTLSAALGIRALWAPLGLILLAPLLFAVLGVLVPLALGARGWNAGRLGALYAGAAVLEALVHPLLGRWTDRQGALAPTSAGLVASIAVLLGLAGAGPAWLVAGLVVAAAITFGATLVPGMALVTRAADLAGLDGVLAIALANLAWALGHAVGAPLCGWLADRAGDTVTYALFAALCLAVLVVLRRKRAVLAAGAA
jgi:predicted MFS family arabinose efflux permease